VKGVRPEGFVLVRPDLAHCEAILHHTGVGAYERFVPTVIFL
jgi:hypothetical protein